MHDVSYFFITGKNVSSFEALDLDTKSASRIVRNDVSSYKQRTKSTPHTVNPYPTAFPYGNGMILHFYQQQESSTTKTVHKVINKRLKTYV